jgi:AcrR family transcriptional regulator
MLLQLDPNISPARRFRALDLRDSKKEGTRPLALRSADRTIERRRVAYEDEVNRLVAASFALVRRKGSLEPTVGEIVAESGLSNQAFYKHFRSKDELLLAVLDEGIRILRSYLEHQMEKATTHEEKLKSWLSGILEQALNDEASAATRPFALSRARLSDLFPVEVDESEAQLTDILRSAIEDAAKAGEIPSADPERDAALLYGLAMGWVERALADPAKARREDADYLIEFAIAGLHRSSKARP